MGTNVSTQMIESTTNIVNESLTEISSEIENNASGQVSISQSMPIEIIGIEATSSSFEFNQTASASVTVILENSTEMNNDLANKLEAKLTETLSNELTQANEDLNLGQTNISAMQSSTSTFIKQNITNLIHTGIKNSVTVNSHGIQSMPITLKNSKFKDSQFKVTQSMQLEAVAKNISSAIVTNVVKNVLTADVKKEISNKAEQLNKGVDILAIVGILVICGCGVGAFVMFKGISSYEDTANKAIDAYKENTNKMDIKTGGGNMGLKIKISIGIIILIVLFLIFIKYKKDEIKNNYDISYLDE